MHQIPPTQPYGTPFNEDPCRMLNRNYFGGFGFQRDLICLIHMMLNIIVNGNITHHKLTLNEAYKLKNNVPQS